VDFSAWFDCRLMREVSTTAFMEGLSERTIPLAAKRAMARHEAAEHQRPMSQEFTIKLHVHKRWK